MTRARLARRRVDRPRSGAGRGQLGAAARGALGPKQRRSHRRGRRCAAAAPRHGKNRIASRGRARRRARRRHRAASLSGGNCVRPGGAGGPRCHSSRALASAEAAGRLSLVAQPLHVQAKALRARAAEQAYLVRAVALQKRPLVAGAEWLAERAVEGAAVARRVQHKRSPPRSWQAASSAAWPRLRRSQRSSCCPRPETLPSGRAAPAARSGRGRRRRRSNSNPPQDFPACGAARSRRRRRAASRERTASRSTRSGPK